METFDGKVFNGRLMLSPMYLESSTSKDKFNSSDTLKPQLRSGQSVLVRFYVIRRRQKAKGSSFLRVPKFLGCGSRDTAIMSDVINVK